MAASGAIELKRMGGRYRTAAGPVRGSDYLPIAEHGLIGDLRTVALVGSNGTIDST
jgi:hypothetical protein